MDDTDSDEGDSSPLEDVDDISQSHSATGRFNNSPVVSHGHSTESSDPFHNELTLADDEDFVECPLCGEMFPSDTVNVHAAGCHGNGGNENGGMMGRGVGGSNRDSNGGGDVRGGGNGSGGASSFVQCPLCEDMFPSVIINQHASMCCL
jgi:uncharacterized C2H2 Zn-finger protein